MGGGYLSVFVWVVGSCLALSRLEVLMSKRLLVILYMVESLASAFLCSRVGQERAEAKVDIQMLMFQIVYGSHTGQQYSRCGRTRQSPIGIALDGLVNRL